MSTSVDHLFQRFVRFHGATANRTMFHGPRVPEECNGTSLPVVYVSVSLPQLSDP